MAMVPETQMEFSVVEEEDEEDKVEEIGVSRRRQGSILPVSVTEKSSFEVCLNHDLADDSGQQRKIG